MEGLYSTLDAALQDIDLETPPVADALLDDVPPPAPDEAAPPREGHQPLARVRSLLAAQSKDETKRATLMDAIRRAEGQVQLESRSQEAAAMREWAESTTWTYSAMHNNEWAFLPVLVLDVVVRRHLGITDVKSCVMTCRLWSEAMTKKIPYTQEMLKWDREFRREQRQQRRGKEEMKRRAEAIRRRRVTIVMLQLLIPSAVCLLLALIGSFYFSFLFASVSIVPQCSAATGLTASLYSCAAGLFVASLLLLVWAGATLYFNLGKGFTVMSLHRFERYLNEVGTLVCIQIWCSAAACVHFSNTCIESYPLVSTAARAYAAGCLICGLVMFVWGTMRWCVGF